ncbi:hypothetical protein AAG570_003215 [Ranatra chinensis]|uniref:Glucose dehydrogenase n=1 Tax=Ranatra chinensis TaxID=642074 RepID=A0ABD0Y792_9HEMI
MSARTLKSRPSRPLAEYDFVVVGAGPAGAVVANRLSEDPSVRVLLLEAGPSDNALAYAPILNTYLIFTELSWNFMTERPGSACRGLEDERCPWPSGRGAGGGSGMNAMIYTRGHQANYDDWAARGNTGWSYEEVLPYFLKSERVNIPQLRKSPFHGHSGNLTVRHVPFTSQLMESFIEAGRLAGYSRVDYSDPRSQEGFSQIQATVDEDGLRSSAVTAFMRPVANRPNLHMAFNTRVTKVLIDPKTMRAYGVEYKTRGIGHADHLREFGIPVLKDLPVGDNLLEHLGMNGLVFLIDQPVGLLAHELLANVVGYTAELVNNRRGPLTSLGCEAIGFVRTKYANLTGGLPDLELLFVPSAINQDGGYSLRKTMGVTDALYDNVYADIDRRHAFTIWPIPLYPRSKGTVRLRDADPLSKVRIYPNFLTHPLDVAVMVEGLKTAVEMGEGPAFRWAGARLHRVPFPRCARLQFGSEPYWECAAREMTSQFHHQCCTAGMGRVVDPRLRVYGVQGLRLADASVMPDMVGGHTQATCYMIGEKAADMIKEDWNMLR